ncbi:MAG: hypothetical protein KQI62_09160 [Deltaproteobacteria bacterium]|nr:hypothetical protein [Deltaproteobacteria bacterium]
MKIEATPTKAGQDYAAAHAMHYKDKDLNAALDLYQGVMTAHPDTPESGYSRSQIQNIAKSVVPSQVLLEGETAMARAHIKQQEQPAKDPSPKA